MSYSAKGKRYLMSLCEMACTFCGVEPANVAHHIRLGTDCGISMKPSDKWAIPCCHSCHSQLHTKYGEKKFFERHGYTVEDVKNKASELWEASINK